jgi:hypothetical protein
MVDEHCGGAALEKAEKEVLMGVAELRIGGVVQKGWAMRKVKSMAARFLGHCPAK